MDAQQILTIQRQLLDQHLAVRETGKAVKQIGRYPDQAQELDKISYRLLAIFYEIETEPTE